MRYAGIIKNDISAAPGVCVTFFTQGCPFHCIGCHNPSTWDFNGGRELTDTVINDLIDAINDNISKMRQDRENEKKEEELSDKERRLMYLQQDTTGANILEVLKLQDELDKGYEDYTDSLIDQAISEIQKANEEAAEQRDEQIELLEEQITFNAEHGYYVQRTMDLIENEEKEVLKTLLQSADNFFGMSPTQQGQWLKEFEDTYNSVRAGIELIDEEGIPIFFSYEEMQAYMTKAMDESETNNATLDSIVSLRNSVDAIRENMENGDSDVVVTNATGPRFAEGGAANFTGPAWLDGTRAKPEIVLNSSDSQNLIQLRDILRNRNWDRNSEQITGDSYYKIDINVESIDSDYSVDAAIERVKADILSAAQYRNFVIPVSTR